MMEATMAASGKIRPFWGRVAVLDSPVDEEQRASGLIVPLGDPGVRDVKRGIVTHIDQTYHDTEGSWSAYAKQIDTGTVVYFREKDAVPVLDLWLLTIDDIVAYEVDE